MRLTTLAIHIIAGSVGILSGFVALYVTKGATVHRRSGMVFVYAMLTMSLVGATLAAVRGVAPAANVPVGVLTAYLVITALTTVRPPSAGSRPLDFGLMLVAVGVSLALFTFGFKAVASPTGKLHGMPSVPFFIFGSVGLLSSVGDLRLIWSGGVHAIRGARRLARHLWRMSFALLIAAFSFFLGQAKVIPKPIRILPLLLIPPLIVLTAMLYWLWRVRMRRFGLRMEPRYAERPMVRVHDRGNVSLVTRLDSAAVRDDWITDHAAMRDIRCSPLVPPQPRTGTGRHASRSP